MTSSAHVAGRSVYQLTLTPKTAATLVSTVTLSIDSKTGLPLKVAVAARGQKGPALSVGFSSIDFSAPAATLFRFTPPKEAKVTTKSFDHVQPGAGFEPPTKGPKPSVSGSGWSSIVELPAGSLGSGSGTIDPGQARLLDQLTTSVDGGRALQTSLVSVLLTTDGRVFAGAVPIASLEAAAAAR